MRRTIPLLAVAASLVLAAGPTAAAPSSGGSLVAGSGWRIAGDSSDHPGDPRVEFKVAAKFAGPASGTYQYANVDGLRLNATITCGGTDAGVAVIGGHITGGDLVGYNVLVFFVDNGKPTFGSVGPDHVSGTLIPEPGEILGDDFPADFPAHCPAPRGATFQAHALLTVLGDIVVQ